MEERFHKVAGGFDVAPAVAEFWQLAAPDSIRIDRGADGTDTVPYVLLYKHPKFANLGVQNARFVASHALLNRAVEALGNPEVYVAALRALPPRGKVAPHSDNNIVPTGWRRHHLALQSDAGAEFVIEDERRHFKPGELWRVNLLDRRHYAVNNSNRTRIIMMIDAYTAGPLDAAEVARVEAEAEAADGPDWRRLHQLWAQP